MASIMLENWQVWVAVYAAIVATGTLYFQIRRWGPRPHLTVSPNSRTFPLSDKQLYVMVKVSNRGSLATTINAHCVHIYDNWWKKFRRQPSKSGVVREPQLPFNLKSLPHVLEPGEEWSGFITQSGDFEKWAESGRLYVAIYTSHTSRPIVKHVKQVKNQVAL